MNINPKTPTDIEQNERWLKTFADPVLDPSAVVRVKNRVRLARECDTDPHAAKPALAAAKTAVRRELSTTTHAPGNPALQRWAPLLAAAAATAFVFVSARTAPRLELRVDPELTRFVETLARPTETFEQQMIDLESEFAALDAEFTEFSVLPMSDWLLENDDTIESESIDMKESS